MGVRRLGCLSLLCFLASNLSASPRYSFQRRWLSAKSASSAAAPSHPFKKGTIEQSVDPRNPSDPRTFLQRYFIDDEFAAGQDSPVFFYLCGESSCGNHGFDGSNYTFPAQKYHGYNVILEHRYYGQSQPFPDVMTTANLAYLTIPNALHDAANFEVFLKKKLGLTGPWIVIGGSYSGSLAAYYRLAYPQLTVGAHAMSAPVEARDNFEDYDRFVGQVAGVKCADAMRKVTRVLEASQSDVEKFNAYKRQFGAEKVLDATDFLYVVADIGAAAFQDGDHDAFCKALTAASDPVKAYADYGIKLSKDGFDAYSDTPQAIMGVDTAPYESGPADGQRQWNYQSCTEVGYWQNAFHDPAQSVRSAQINPDYHRRLCQTVFGITKPPDTQFINDTYYASLIAGPIDHILFTNGSLDPWSQLSISQELGNDSNPGLTLFTVAGAAHCGDGGKPKPTDSAPVAEAKQLFDSQIESWLTHR